MKRSLYAVIRQIPVLGKDVERTSACIKDIYPGMEQLAGQRAAVHCIKNWGLCSGIMCFYLWTGWNYISEIALMAVSCFMFYRYRMYSMLEREEVQLLWEMERFLGELKFRYQTCGRIEEALEICLGSSGEHMRLHGKLLLDAIEEEEGERRFYNRFLALLYALCKIVYEYGDTKTEGTTLCLENLGLIKEAVVFERMRRKRLEHIFSGLMLICMLSLPFVKIIELWSLGNMKELKLYYQGSYGMVATLCVCGISVLCFLILQRLRYEFVVPAPERKWLAALEKVPLLEQLLSWQINFNYTKSIRKHRILKECGIHQNVRQFLLLQYVTAMITALLSLGMVLNMQSICKNTIILRTEHMIGNLYQLQEKEALELTGLIRNTVVGKHRLTKEELRKCQLPEEMQETVLYEIEQAAKEWKEWNYSWYVFLIPVAAGILAYHGRYALLYFRRRTNELKREEEILVFQSVILFLMHLENITVQEVAQWLERFSDYFREVMEKAQYRLGYEDYEETELLKEKETNLGMLMILEGMLACDQVSVEEAFLQQKEEYYYTREQYRGKQERYLTDKGAVGRLIGFIPLYVTVACKLIAPFVLEGISQLSVYADSMKQFM